MSLTSELASGFSAVNPLAQYPAAADGVRAGCGVAVSGMGRVARSSKIAAETVFIIVAAWHIRTESSRGPGVLGDTMYGWCESGGEWQGMGGWSSNNTLRELYLSAILRSN